MSFVDDVENDLIIEQGLKQSALEKYMSKYPHQYVVNSAILSFKSKPVEAENSLEEVSKNILITVARTKRVSPKQKNCLIRMLINRHEKGYEY